MEANMAVGLFNEIKSRAPQGGDWERDFTRMQQQSDAYDRKQAITAAFARIAAAFRPARFLETVRA